MNLKFLSNASIRHKQTIKSSMFIRTMVYCIQLLIQTSNDDLSLYAQILLGFKHSRLQI